MFPLSSTSVAPSSHATTFSLLEQQQWQYTAGPAVRAAGDCQSTSVVPSLPVLCGPQILWKNPGSRLPATTADEIFTSEYVHGNLNNFLFCLYMRGQCGTIKQIHC